MSNSVAQLCPTLCNPMDCSPPGSAVHGDSSGKNTGVGCYALLQGVLPDPGTELSSLMSPALAGGFSTTSATWGGFFTPQKITINWSFPTLTEVKWSESCTVVSDSLLSHGLHSPWNSPGQNTGVGSHSLLQGIFPTQGSNPGLPHCRRILYQLSHKGRPPTLK